MQQPLPEMITIPAYTTGFGAAYCGDSLDLLAEYVEGLAQFARQVYRVLKDDGSFVLDLGGAYEKGVPEPLQFPRPH